MRKVLISPSSFSKKYLEILKKKNLKIILNPYGRTFTKEEIMRFLKDADYLIAGTEILNQEVLKKANKLKVISRLGLGMDNIDLKYARSSKIKVLKLNSGLEETVAELTLTLILSLLRDIPNYNQEIRAGIWNKRMGNLLWGKKVGILGLGNIAKRLIEILKVFKVKILVNDINPDKKFIENNQLKLVDFKTLLKESDILSLHLNYSRENENLISFNEFNLMKKDLILINTSRGKIINEEALYQALKNQKIKAAALDVFQEEPYNGKLKELNNVILTPHIGSYTEAREEMEKQTVLNLLKAIC
ncbi:MAG: phosphoglycerate dehydrogenase [Armatimonadetes bacterium]|nr:phosphoglycerate dehydrogenase [Armatimonadota bacterium]